eukprot:4837679-Pleurochrysis_carterae.AAC.1
MPCAATWLASSESTRCSRAASAGAAVARPTLSSRSLKSSLERRGISSSESRFASIRANSELSLVNLCPAPARVAFGFGALCLAQACVSRRSQPNGILSTSFALAGESSSSGNCACCGVAPAGGGNSTQLPPMPSDFGLFESHNRKPGRARRAARLA